MQCASSHFNYTLIALGLLRQDTIHSHEGGDGEETMSDRLLKGIDA